MNTDKIAFTRPKSKWTPPGNLERGCWTTYYRLGVIAQRQLPVFRSFEEVGRAVGVTKQNAYTEVVVALGKVVFAMRHELRFPIRVNPCSSVVENKSQ